MATAGSGKLLAADDAVQWRTGTELRLHLQSRVTVTWSGESSTLRNILSNVSQRERMALFLDRRVDPNQPVELTARDESWINLLKKLSEQLDLGICLVDDVVYLGPKHAAANLTALCNLRTQELRNLSQAAVRQFTAKQPWAWDDLTTPRELIPALADTQAVDVQGLERVPHDLWPANDLPPLTFVKRLSLVLVGFDLTFEYTMDGSAIRIVPVPDHIGRQRTFAVGVTARSKAEQLAAEFPKAKIRVEGGNIVVEGTADELYDIDQWLQGKRVRRGTVPGEKRFTLKADSQPIVALLNAVANQLEVRLHYDPAIEEKLQKRMSIDVKNATIEKLLEAILQPVSLSYELDDEQLSIAPAGD